MRINIKPQFISALLLLAVCLVAFGTVRAPIITSDDWSYFVADYAFGDLRPVNLGDRRPFILLLYFLISRFAGLHFEYYYVFNLLVHFATGLLVYAVCRRAFQASSWTASLVAVVFLVYPVDYSRTWIIMLYIRFWWAVTLGAIWFALDFAASGKPIPYLLAMAGFIVPLGSYEGQVGLVLLSLFLIAILKPVSARRNRFTLILSALGLLGAFVLWRFFLQERFLQINDPYVGSLTFDLPILATRYLRGLQIFTLGWVGPLHNQLALLGVQPIPLLAGHIILLCVLAIVFAARKKLLKDHYRETFEPNSHSYLATALIGAGMWVAGYVPIILLYEPSLEGFASRVNSFPILGASILTVSLAGLCAALLSKSPRQQALLTTTLIAPLVIAGVFVQLTVNQERFLAWQTQKSIWNETFRVVPDIKDGRRLVLIIPGYQALRPLQFLPFLTGWEVEAAARVLYNNSSLGAHYYYEDIQDESLHFLENGFRPVGTNRSIPYRQLVFLRYNAYSDSMELISDLDQYLSQEHLAGRYEPLSHLMPARPEAAEYRWLVR